MLPLLLCLLLPQVPADAATLPSVAEFGRRVKQALEIDQRGQDAFTYRERRRDIKVSRLGRVSVGPVRTFEVFPSVRPGGTYKRLIEVDDKPLPADELARADAEHARDLRDAEERQRDESATQRARRLREREEEQQERDAILADAIAVFAATPVGRDTIDGRPVIVADVKPRPDAHVTTRQGRWMKSFAGRIWVAEQDYHLVRIDMRAFEDITIGWGVVGRVHEGARIYVSRRRFEDIWLPGEVTYAASGRTLRFRSFDVEATSTYADDRRR
jgi:hypothetical protein